ncbi:MAG: hypothetical protein ACOX2F_06750 [bacterium]
MENLKSYVADLNNSLKTVFDHTEKTCAECKTVIDFHNTSVLLPDELKKNVGRLVSLLQFGDIISQSFESFTVIFDEIARLEKVEHKLDRSQAERFAELVGTISVSTFSLTGKTVLNLKESLLKTEELLIEAEFKKETVRCVEFVAEALGAIEAAVRKTATAKKGTLLSLESIFSPVSFEEDAAFSERLYKKMRTKEHVEILGRLFPSGKSYLNASDLELF